MPVLAYLVRRVAWAVVLMLGTCLITFVCFYVVPQDRGRFVFRADQTVEGTRRASDIHGPVYAALGRFVERVVVERDLGRSLRSRRDVTEILADAIPVTGSLVLGGAVLWLLLGVPLGVLSALRPRSLLDRLSMVFVLVGLSIHPVALGLMLSWLLGLHWHVLPFFGYADFFHPPPGIDGGPTQWAYHLVLPWITYALLFAALYVRMIRALLPLTAMLSMDLAPRMLLSVVFVERVFDLPGLGGSLWQAVDRNDLPVTVGIVLLLALMTCVFNLVADVVQTVLDPRARRAARPRCAPAPELRPAPAAVPQRAS